MLYIPLQPLAAPAALTQPYLCPALNPDPQVKLLYVLQPWDHRDRMQRLLQSWRLGALMHRNLLKWMDKCVGRQTCTNSLGAAQLPKAPLEVTFGFDRRTRHIATV